VRRRVAVGVKPIIVQVSAVATEAGHIHLHPPVTKLQKNTLV
jgi:hypothetical protein